MNRKLELACNEAVDTARRIAQARQLAAFGSIDAKRSTAWTEYGYKDTLAFADFFNLYSRHGIAHGVVSQLTRKCWQSAPEVIEGEADEKSTAWEAEFAKLAKSVRLWGHFADGDRRRMVGHYSGLLLQIADGRQWNQPVDTLKPTLVRIVPAWEGQLEVTGWDTDPQSADYGAPTMWQYNENQVEENKTDTSPGRSIQVHPDRVFVLGDPRTGVPLLQAGFNDFVNLEKILGGSGESFLKNASRQVAVNFDKEVDLSRIAQAHGVPLADLHKVFNAATRDLNMGIDSMLITQGATTSALVANVPDPEPHFGIALQSAAASVCMPAKVVVGMQTGERASTEDLADFNAMCQGRRETLLAWDIEDFVAHLVRIKLLAPAPGPVSVVWDDLTAAGPTERMEQAKGMAEVNAKMLASGDLVFTVEEIRTAAGYDNDDPMPALPDVDPEQ